MAKGRDARNHSRAQDVTRMQKHHHGHPRIWMTILLAGAGAGLIVLMGFAALEIAEYTGL